MRIFVVALLVLLTASPREHPGSDRHFELRRSVPEGYAAVDTVSEIRLWFTDRPAEGTTSIRVKDERDADVPTRGVVKDPRDDTSYSVALLRRLPPGRYTVLWEARALDGDRVDSYFPFQVTDAREERRR